MTLAQERYNLHLELMCREDNVGETLCITILKISQMEIGLFSVLF